MRFEGHGEVSKRNVDFSGSEDLLMFSVKAMQPLKYAFYFRQADIVEPALQRSGL